MLFFPLSFVPRISIHQIQAKGHMSNTQGKLVNYLISAYSHTILFISLESKYFHGLFTLKTFLTKLENDWSSSNMDSDNEKEAGTGTVPKSSLILRSSNSPYTKVSSKEVFHCFIRMCR